MRPLTFESPFPQPVTKHARIARGTNIRTGFGPRLVYPVPIEDRSIFVSRPSKVGDSIFEQCAILFPQQLFFVVLMAQLAVRSRNDLRQSLQRFGHQVITISCTANPEDRMI